MPRLCSVCTHPQHRQIDAALIEHTVPFGAIAKGYGFSWAAVWRHKTHHLRERLEEARMLDAQALAARMAQLDGHVDRILESAAGNDERLALLAVSEGRRNIDTLMRLIVLHVAEQNDAAREAVVAGYPSPMLPENPERIRTVLKMLIESGAALSTPEERAAEQEEHQRANHNRDDDDDPGYHTVPAV